MTSKLSRYDALCEAYATSRKKYFEYQKSCWEFGGKLMHGLIANYDIPDERVRLIPVHEPAEVDRKYTLAEAMKLFPDTFWHFGVEFTLCENPDLCLQLVLVHVGIKKKNDVFQVRLGEQSDEGFHIDPNEPEHLKGFYDFVFNHIKNAFEHGLEEFLENPSPDNRHEVPRKIGF